MTSFSKCRAAVEVACRDAPHASLPLGIALTLDEWVAVGELALVLQASQPISQLYLSLLTVTQGFGTIYRDLARLKYVSLNETAPMLDFLLSGLKEMIWRCPNALVTGHNAAMRAYLLIQDHYGDAFPNRVSRATLRT